MKENSVPTGGSLLKVWSTGYTETQQFSSKPDFPRRAQVTLHETKWYYWLGIHSRPLETQYGTS